MPLDPHHIHEFLRSAHGAVGGADHIGEHKAYPRFPRVALDGAALPMSLEEALHARQSKRTPSPAPLSLSVLATTLERALGARDSYRMYPSGGAKYPIETYLLSVRVAGLERHAYHYAPTMHALEDLWEIPADSGVFEGRLNAPWEGDVNAFIIFTTAWKRSQEKYGNFALELALLEAGHMAQNVLLAAAALNTNACPFGGFNTAIVRDLLDLTDEQAVYGVALL